MQSMEHLYAHDCHQNMTEHTTTLARPAREEPMYDLLPCTAYLFLGTTRLLVTRLLTCSA